MSAQLIYKTPSAYHFPLLIKHLLHTPKRIAREQEIVYRDIRRYSYEEFFGRIDKVANALTSLGVTPGSTVGVMDWDSYRYLECYFAVPMMGAILHTVNVRLSPEQILYTINHAEDDVLIVHSDFVGVIEMIKNEFTTVKKIILLQDVRSAISTTIDFAGEYEELVSAAPEGYDFPDFDENVRATTFYTTGTTGLPKGVYFSHRQLVLHTIATSAGMSALKPYSKGFTTDDVYMPITPMFHVHAWGFPYIATLIGAKQVYPGRYEPEMLLKIIQKEKVTFSHCVPTILHMILSHPMSREVDLSEWRVIVGGAAFPEALCRSALAKGIDAYSAYGMSETCPILTLANLRPDMVEWDREQQIPIRCRTGLPVPLVELEVVDPEGKPLPHDGKNTGEVVARCPWLTQGYFKEKERSEELWRGGWLHTGDVGYIDERGYLKITDRIKDVIKTGGEWISSLSLENIILDHEAVSEAAAIGIPHEKWGERPVVLVVLKPEYRDTVEGEELRDFYNEYVKRGVISKWGVPDRIVIVDQIPKTSVGKLNKKVIRKQIASLLD